MSQNEGEAQLQRRTRDAEGIKVTAAAEAMQHASQPLVPQIVMGGERSASGIVDLLMAMSLSNGSVGATPRPSPTAQR